MSHDGRLTASHVRQFHKDGYLVLPDFFDATPLLEHAKHVVSSFDPTGHPLAKFSTGRDSDLSDADEYVGDRYFLESGAFVRYFLEEGAISSVDGSLTVPKDRAVNKVGHNLHSLDPVFREFSFAENVKNVARSLNVHKDPKVLQSMIICKQPEIGGAVPAHNDSTFLYTDPPSATGLWFALEDCTKTNGCLSFLPGSHRWPKGEQGPAGHSRPSDDLSDELGQPRGVNKRFVRNEPNDPDKGTGFETLATDEEAKWQDAHARVEECSAGTLVLIHGSVLHKSEKNLSQKSRYIYTYHMIEGDAELAKYDEKNWLQPTDETPFPSLYDA